MPLIVLPDVDIREDAMMKLHDIVGPVLCRHRSGRPWIIGRSAAGHFIEARNRHLNVAVAGHADIDSDTLVRSLADSDRIEQTSDMADQVVEFDVLLFVRDNKQLRAYAPPFQSRSLFWTVFNGLTVVSDEQYPLAALNGFELDKRVLAARLVNTEISHPFTRRPIWRRVDALGIGECLVVDDAGKAQRTKWWVPPKAAESLEELAPVLSRGIDQAVSSRVKGRSVVSADLSGGLDSTTLTFLLANTGLELHTLFMQVENLSNNDRKWSDRAANEVASHHRKISYQSVLNHVANELQTSVTRFPEGPGALSTAVASAAILEQHLKATGSTLHLNGHAGDALFGQVSSAIWSYFRIDDPGRYRWLRRYRTMNRIPPSAMMRMLFDRRTFSKELEQISVGKYRYPKYDPADYATWIQTPRFANVFTQAAKDEVAKFARVELADGACELSADRTTHQILSYLAVHGAVTRRMNYVSETMQFDSPYLDRRIVEPALALNHRDRARQSPTKPLLAAARPPMMSLDYFLRQDKGDYTAEVFDHHQTIFNQAQALFSEGSILAEMGLVDDESVGRIVNSYSADGAAYSDIIDLEFAERWVRSVHDEQTRLVTRGNCKW